MNCLKKSRDYTTRSLQMSDRCPNCKRDFHRRRQARKPNGEIDEDHIDTYHPEEFICPMCLHCQAEVYRNGSRICDCSECLREVKYVEKKKYDASPEGIAEAKKKSEEAAREAAAARLAAAAAARASRDAEKLRYAGMRAERDAELAQARTGKKGKKGKKGKRD